MLTEKQIKNTMRRMRRNLALYGGRCASDCGFDENVEKTLDLEFKILEDIELSIRAANHCPTESATLIDKP